MEGSTGVPLVGGNAVAILNNGDEFYPRMLADIHAARRTITMEAYIYWEGDIGKRFAEALAQKAREGVRVRVLYDWVGSFMVSRSFWRELDRAGVEVRAANPPTIGSPLRAFERGQPVGIEVDGATHLPTSRQ